MPRFFAVTFLYCFYRDARTWADDIARDGSALRASMTGATFSRSES